MEVEGLKGRMTSVVVMRLIEENKRLRGKVRELEENNQRLSYLLGDMMQKLKDKTVELTQDDEDCLEDWGENNSWVQRQVDMDD